MECEVCGSRNVVRKRIEGHLLEECNLCGNIQGDDQAVARVEELRQGRERGLEEELIPLVSALESTEMFRVTQATAGNPATGESPHVFFRLARNDASCLELLMRSIEMANRKTRLRWLIELSLQHELVYILRPRFWKPPSAITTEEIERARADLPVLSQQLRRDVELSWWKR